MNDQLTVQAIEGEFGGADAEMARRLQNMNLAPSPGLVAQVQAIPVQSRSRQWRAMRFVWTSVAVVLLLVGLTVALPTMRAALGVVLESIGDVYLAVTDHLFETTKVVTIEQEWMPLEDAQAVVPYDFGFPTAAPDGWAMDAQVGVGYPEGIPVVEIQWTNLNHAGVIHLLIQPTHRPDDGTPLRTLVGTDSYQEIEINGVPAVFVKGGWDTDTREWLHPDVITILWRIGDVRYSLYTNDDSIPQADLVRMAESIQ